MGVSSNEKFFLKSYCHVNTNEEGDRFVGITKGLFAFTSSFGSECSVVVFSIFAIVLEFKWLAEMNPTLIENTLPNGFS